MNTADHNPHNPIAAPDYLVALGLQQHPYLESSDARFFYADPILVQRLDLLQHLTQFGDMLLGVSGPVGSGKTTLAQQFLLRGNSNWRSCRLNGAHLQHPDALLVKLAECFGLQASATPERLKAELVRHCQTLRHNTQIAVVVIDDAQQLPDPVLKALLELADGPRETLKLLRVILFSEPGLEQRLAATGWHSPQQPLLHNLDIPRFDEQQTAAYLMYRLAVAGYSGESPFSLTEIRALYKATDGLPGKLNVLAHETLIERAGRIAARKNVAARGSRRTRPVMALVMALGLIGSLVVGGLAWYLNRERATQEFLAPPLESAISIPESPAPSLNAKDASPTSPTEPAETPKEEPKKSLETTPETQQHAEVKSEIKTEPLPKPIPEPAPPTQAPDAHPSVPADIPAPAPAPDSAPALNNPVPPTQPAAPTATPATPEIAAPTPNPMATPAPKPEPAEKSPPSPTTAAVAPVPKPSPPATPAPAATGSKQLGTDWLQSRPGAHFTLQLLGGRSEKSLHDYLRQHRIPEPIATFRTVFKGGDWYVLVHGDFPSMTAARAAVATLPATVRKGKPWARNFASVHADMQKARP